MHRRAIAVLLLGFALTEPTFAATKTPATTKKATNAKPKKVPCAPNLAHCPDEGCGKIVKGVKSFDPNLNKQKNIRVDAADAQGPATVMTLTEIKQLDDPENFAKGDDRDEIRALGEGKKVTVLAYLLIARDEPGGESCNCGLTSKAETDNHLVLVSKFTVDTFPLDGTTKPELKAVLDQREEESITAEFTPRVRLDHPNFLKKTMDPLIKNAKEQALQVRVTGVLMFDSEHFLGHHLKRVNNWEIHPVLKMEFCETGWNCKVGTDTGWKSIDDLP
jgi:hypothetical protein